MTAVKLLVIVLLFFSSFATSQEQAAEDAGVFSYCSMRTTDGVWAVRWGRTLTAIQCRYVRHYLYLNASGPIVARSMGTIGDDQSNLATVVCQGVRRVFWGVGIWPLRSSFEYARRQNLSHCLFSVRAL